MRTLHQLYKILAKKVKNKEDFFICNQIGFLLDNEKITTEEKNLLMLHFQSQIPTENLHPEFFNNYSFQKGSSIYGSWWAYGTQPEKTKQRKLFIKKMIEITAKQDLIDRQVKLLDETMEYYSADPENRRCEGIQPISGGKMCFYSPVKANKPLSQGCAIGRLVSKKLKLELDTVNPNGVGVNTIFHLIPLKLQKLGLPFLMQLQSFHDTKAWDESSLIQLTYENLRNEVKQGDYTKF